MAKSEHFTSLQNQNTQVEFSRRAVNENELYYNVTLTPGSGHVNLTIKKNKNGHWEIEDRTHLPPWVINLEPEFIKAIRKNEA